MSTALRKAPGVRSTAAGTLKGPSMTMASLAEMTAIASITLPKTLAPG